MKDAYVQAMNVLHRFCMVAAGFCLVIEEWLRCRNYSRVNAAVSSPPAAAPRP